MNDFSILVANVFSFLRFVVAYVINVTNVPNVPNVIYVIYVTFVFLENSFIYYICLVLFTPVFYAVRSPRLDSSVG